MDNWSTLVPTDVTAEFAPDELAALQAVVESDIPGLIGRVTSEVRDYYASGGRAIDSAQNTIPDALKPHAIAIVRWRMLISSPALKALQTKEREAACNRSLDYLTEIAQRRITGTGFAQLVNKQPRVSTRKTLSGL